MRRSIKGTHSAVSPKRVAVLKAPLLHEGAADALRNMIIEDDLSPGARLPEIELCELLGISRTPEMRAHFIEEHEAIAQALMRREGEMVYSEIKRHLARVGAMLGAPD